jgi:hypothetical protein
MRRITSLLALSIALTITLGFVSAAEPQRPRPAVKPADPKAPKRVVFLVSSAASMIHDYKNAANFVSDRIWELNPEVQFNLITYGGEQTAALSPKAPLKASDENKKKAEEFYNAQETVNTSLPLVGIAEALKSRPDAVYWVTNGTRAEGSPADLAAAVKKLNAAAKAKIHVFLVGREIPKEDKEAFKKVAEANGGILRELTEKELE